jgi:Antitoxin-like ribbon-helix-helix
MAPRAADLRQVMQASAKPAVRVPSSAEQPKKAAPTYPDNPHYRPGRAGRTNVTGYFPQEVKKQLRMLAAEKETTIQSLLGEALNDLFAKNGKPEIAPIEGD